MQTFIIIDLQFALPSLSNYYFIVILYFYSYLHAYNSDFNSDFHIKSALKKKMDDYFAMELDFQRNCF